jgi:hypothetical protein
MDKLGGQAGVEITEAMVEAGASHLREHCDMEHYWSRGVARAVFTLMERKRLTDAATNLPATGVLCWKSEGRGWHRAPICVPR